MSRRYAYPARTGTAPGHDDALAVSLGRIVADEIEVTLEKTEEIESFHVALGLFFTSNNQTNSWYYSTTGANDDWIDGSSSANLQIRESLDRSMAVLDGNLYVFDASGSGGDGGDPNPSPGRYQVSPDGMVFDDYLELPDSLTSYALGSVGFGNDSEPAIIAMYDFNTSMRGMQTTDGTNWTTCTGLSAGSAANSIRYLNGKWYCVTSGAFVMESDDNGITWTQIASLRSPFLTHNMQNIQDIDYFNGQFILVGINYNSSTSGRVITTPDFTTWTVRITGVPPYTFQAVDNDGTKAVLLSDQSSFDDERIYRTTDGTTFDDISSDQTWQDYVTVDEDILRDLRYLSSNEWWVANTVTVPANRPPARALTADDDWQEGPATVTPGRPIQYLVYTPAE